MLLATVFAGLAVRLAFDSAPLIVPLLMAGGIGPI